MFERARRARDADRSRIAPTLGYVGRNVGDQPYIMDLVYQWHFMGGSLGNLSGAGSGSGSADALAGVTAVRLTSGATASSSRRIDVGTNTDAVNMTGYARDANFRSRVRFSTVDANARIFCGFATSSALATAADGLFFGIDGGASTANFVCVARNGGVATTAILDGGGTRANIPVDTAWHDVSIVCDSTAGEVRFYVDRQLAATLTTDLPSDASDYFTPHYSTQNGDTASARYIDVDVLVLAEAAP